MLKPCGEHFYWQFGGRNSDNGAPFNNLATWTNVAIQVCKEFKNIGVQAGMDLYFELVPYTCTGIIRGLDHSEMPARTQTVILEKTTSIGKKVVAFSLDKWYGPENLEIGQKVLLGQDGRSGHYFPMTRSGTDCVMSEEMRQMVAGIEKELAAAEPAKK